MCGKYAGRLGQSLINEVIFVHIMPFKSVLDACEAESDQRMHLSPHTLLTKV